MTIPTADPVAPGVEIELAARGQRLLAQAIDGCIAGGPMVIAAFVLARLGSTGGVVTILAAVWAGAYLLFADGGGQSIAKKWMGLHVVDATTGAPCTIMQSFVRNFLLMILGPIDWVFIFGERHQRLGDKAAGTIVVAD